MKLGELIKKRERPSWRLDPAYRPLNVTQEQERYSKWLAGETIMANACAIGSIAMPDADRLQFEERFSNGGRDLLYTERRWGDERIINWRTSLDRRRGMLIRTYAALMRDLINYDAERSGLKRDNEPITVAVGEYEGDPDNTIVRHVGRRPESEADRSVHYWATLIGPPMRVVSPSVPFAAADFSDNVLSPTIPAPPTNPYPLGSVIRFSNLDPYARPTEGTSMRLVMMTSLPLVAPDYGRSAATGDQQ